MDRPVYAFLSALLTAAVTVLVFHTETHPGHFTDERIMAFLAGALSAFLVWRAVPLIALIVMSASCAVAALACMAILNTPLVVGLWWLGALAAFCALLLGLVRHYASKLTIGGDGGE